MEITPQIQAILDKLPSSPAAAEEPSLLGRAGQQLANLPSNIVEGLGTGVVNLFEGALPESQRDQISIPHPFDIAAPTTLGQTAVDIGLGKGGLVDVLGQTMIPAGIVGKLGKAVGMAGTGLEAAKMGVGFALPEAARSESTGADIAVAGGLGASQALLGTLPFGARALGSGAIALAHGAYEIAQRGALTGGIAAGVDFLTGLIPGGHTAPKLAEEAETIARNRRALRLEDRKLGDAIPMGRTEPLALEWSEPEGQWIYPKEIRPEAPDVIPGRYSYGKRPELPSIPPRQLMPPGGPEFNSAPLWRETGTMYPERTNVLRPGEEPIVPIIGKRPSEIAMLQNPLEGGILDVPGAGRPNLFLASPERLPFMGGIRPVESGARTPQFAEQMRRAGGIKSLPQRRAPRIGEPSITEVTPTIEEPPLRDAVRPPGATATIPRKLTSEELAYAKDLRQRYNKMDSKDLQALVADLDNEISNSLDEGSVESYRLSREVAAQALETKQAGQPAPTIVASAPTRAEKIRRTQRVGIRSEVGDTDTGRVVSFTKETATIQLDRSAGTVTVPRERIITKDIPEKIAPLQTEVEAQRRQVLRQKEAEQLRKGEQVGTSEVESSGLLNKEAEQAIPGHVPRRSESLSEGWFYRKHEGGVGGPIPAAMHPEAKAAIDRIVIAVKDLVNRHLKVGFSEALESDMAAAVDFSGNIRLSTAHFAKEVTNWHKMSASEQGVALSRLSSYIGHEAGHVALNWIRTEDPVLYRNLMDEFSSMTVESRQSLVEEFHNHVGIKEGNIPYTSGTPSAIAEAYGFNIDNTEAIAEHGFMEFFAEMSAAHIMGRLKEDLLPLQLKSFWQRVKDIFAKIISKFDPGQWVSEEQGLEDQFAANNFKDMLEEVFDRFHKVNGEEYRKGMRRSEKSLYEGQAKNFLKENELRGSTGKESGIALNDEERFRMEESSWDTNSMSAFATLQKTGLFALKLGGYTTTQLHDELGGAVAGAIIGGYAAPNMTDGQMSVAEGILLGGVLGALGPRAIKSLLSIPKSTAGAFHHMTFSESLKAVFTNPRGVAADAATGHGSSVAKFVRFLERNMNLHLPPEVFNAVIDAEGPAAWALHAADDAFKKSKGYKGDATFIKETEKFLKGGDKAAYLNYARSVGTEAVLGANFHVTARESIGILQEMFAKGLPEGAFKEMILKSMQKGDYLTRQYRIFHDTKYQPTQTQIESVAQSITTPSLNLSDARQIVENYLHQIKTEGITYRGSVTDVGKKLDALLFKEKNTKLDAVFRDMLGEYHDPTEKVFGTIQHLYTSAVSGKLLDVFDTLKDNLGLQFSYGLDEHSRIVSDLQHAIAIGRVPAGKTIATLQKELEGLRAYVPLDHATRYGKIGGKMVSRFVRDQLATFDSPFGLLDGSIMRGMAQFHNKMKVARTALNPITVVRNIFSMPVLMAVGGANPLTDIPKAWKAIRDPAMAKEMLVNGILGVDQVKGEMLRNVNIVRMLDTDRGVFAALQKGVNHALEFYRWPDMVVRGATYLAAKERFAKELRLPETHSSVIAKARDWTNRYTVNYANVSPLVKTLRQIPLTNLFISWTAEMSRISKNLVEDVIRHPDMSQRVRALTALGGLAGLPFALEKGSEQMLPASQRKEWEKARSLMPAYQRPNHLIVTGKNPDGRFRFINMTPLVQIDNLTQMMRAAASGDFKALAAVNPIVGWDSTPAVNILTEQVTGKDMRTDRPIDKNMLTRAKAVIKELVPPVLPGGYEYKKVTEAFTETESGELGITNQRSGRRTTPGEIVSSYLTGMRMSTVDPARLQQFAIADAKRKIANEAAYAKDVLNTDLPQPVKDKAIARYSKAQQEILLELTQRLQD